MELIAEDVRKQFGSVTALDGLSLTVPEAVTFGLLGINGAGKTTLFKILVGLDTPDSGRVTIGGRDVTEAGDAIRHQIGYLPERIGFPDALTGREILAFHLQMRGLDEPGRIADALETVGLAPNDADRAVAGYSNGMRRRLGLATAVLSRPPVLILDEPTSGLDPRGVAEFHDIIEQARTKIDATIVIASHVLAEIEQLCDRVAILDDGQTVVAGSVEELTASEEVTVELWPASTTDLEMLERLVGDFGTTSTTSHALNLRTAARDVPAVLARLDGKVDLCDVTIDRKGLEAAFHRAFDPPVDQTPSSELPQKELV